MAWEQRFAGEIAPLGALAACGVALSYLAAAASAGLMPPELQGRPDITPHEFWSVLSRDPGAHLAFHWAWIAAGLFGLMAVPVITLAHRRAHAGALLWSGAAAWLGFAVLARSHLMEVAFDRKIIPHYASASPAFQDAVHVVAGLALDVPDGVLTHGAIGAWLVALSLLAARHQLAPRAFWLLGLAAGATQIAGMLGYSLLYRPLIVLAVGLGGALLMPAWFGWAAWRLRDRAGA